MTYAIVWDESAIDAAARFLKDDPEGLRQLMDAVDLLTDQPRPQGTTPYGSPDLRRMHVGIYDAAVDGLWPTEHLWMVEAAERRRVCETACA